jgi:hypothetical protein
VVEDGFWNCEPSLTVKEMLMVSTKGNEEDIDKFRNSLKTKKQSDPKSVSLNDKVVNE